MAEQQPTIGRIVHYKLSENDIEAMANRRKPNVGHGEDWPAGAQAHVGNKIAEGTVVPMIIVRRVGDDEINGQAFLDGNDVLWLVNIKQGTEGDDQEPGTWVWPPRV